jgi:2-polyprenyl-3-methyl-5-hydroxy-6-metoxy-1,4-benzoquinol methylase
MYLRRIGLMQEFCRCSQGVTRVLDLGCAQGNLALLLAEEGYSCCAVDLRPEFLAYAGLKYERGALPARMAEVHVLLAQKDSAAAGQKVAGLGNDSFPCASYC